MNLTRDNAFSETEDKPIPIRTILLCVLAGFVVMLAASLFGERDYTEADRIAAEQASAVVRAAQNVAEAR